jgi:hypothetical protein
VARRDRMIRPRSSSWLYNYAVETPACVATVRKLISRSEESIRCKAARARCITVSLRSRAPLETLNISRHVFASVERWL